MGKYSEGPGPGPHLPGGDDPIRGTDYDDSDREECQNCGRDERFRGEDGFCDNCQEPFTHAKSREVFGSQDKDDFEKEGSMKQAHDDFEGWDLQGTGRELGEDVPELGDYLFEGDQEGEVHEEFPNFENANNNSMHMDDGGPSGTNDDSFDGGSFVGDKETVAHKKRATVQHLEPGHFYKAHFDCNCGEKHQPYDGRVTVKNVQMEPGGERATLSSSKLGDFEIYGFGDVKAPYSWCYGADADPVTFAHIMGPAGGGGGPAQMGNGGAQGVQPGQPAPTVQSAPKASRRRVASDPMTLDSGNSVVEPEKNNNELDPGMGADQSGLLTQEKSDPHSGVNPAMPPTFQDYNEGLSTVGSFLREAKRDMNDASWFNGTAESIYDQLERLQKLHEQAQRTASSNHLDEGDLESLVKVAVEVKSQIDGLQRVALEYVDFDTDDYIRSLPGGTVASDYGMRLIEAGTQDLGPDDGSFLYREAKKIQSEIENNNWDEFVRTASELWVLDQGEKLLSSEVATREASIMYAQKKTLPVLNVEKRAQVIDGFVTAVEYYRRQVRNNLESIRSNNQRKQASRSDETVSDIMGDNIFSF